MIFAVAGSVVGDAGLPAGRDAIGKLEAPKNRARQFTTPVPDSGNKVRSKDGETLQPATNILSTVLFNGIPGSNRIRGEAVPVSSRDKERFGSIAPPAVSENKRIAARSEDLLSGIRPALQRIGDAEIIAVYEQASSPAAKPIQLRRGKPQRKSPIRLAAQLLLSFLVGAAGVAALPIVYGKLAPLHVARPMQAENFTTIGWTHDPLALTRMYRDNRLLSYVDFVVNRSTKQPYVEWEAAAIEPAGASADPAIVETSSGEDTALASLDGATGEGGPETPPARDGVSKLPSLYFDAAARKQVIGNFETRSFPGGHASCTEIAQSMAADARAGQDSLRVLGDTEEIKVIRICAANGNVVITCRNGRITVSPRRPRPDDGCNAQQAFR